MVWSLVANEFTNMISNFDPSGDNFYKQNLKLFMDEVLLIENWAKDQIKNIPQFQKSWLLAMTLFNILAGQWDWKLWHFREYPQQPKPGWAIVQT